MSASVSFTVDGVTWMKVLKGLAAVVEEANMQFRPNEYDLADRNTLSSEDLNQLEEYKNEMQNQSMKPTFERSNDFPGVSIISLTSSHASMAWLSLPPCFFTKFYASRYVTIGINFSDKEQGLVTMLKPHLTGDCEVCVEVYDSEASPFLKHTIVNKSNKSIMKIKYSVMDIQEHPLDVNYEYCGHAIVSSQSFHRHILSMKSYSAPVNIGFEVNCETGEKKITMECFGTIAQAEAVFEVDDDTHESEEENLMKVEPKEDSALVAVKKEPQNKACSMGETEIDEQDFADIFEDSEDGETDNVTISQNEISQNYEDYVNIDDCGGNDDEEEEWALGIVDSSSISSKKGNEKKAKRKKGNAFCHKLNVTKPFCKSLIGHGFLATASLPIGPMTNLYWGNDDNLPFIVEHDLNKGGRLAHVIAPKVHDDIYEDAIKDI